MSSRRFADPANMRKPNKFGMVPHWWGDMLSDISTSARAVAIMLCLDIDNETGITRKSHTMTEWATKCGLDRGTLRAGLIDLTIAGMIAPERNITATGQKEARTPFRIQFLFANPDDSRAYPPNGEVTATSSNRNSGIQDQSRRQRITTRPRSKTLDYAPEESFEKLPALDDDGASIERGRSPQGSESDIAEKSRIGPEPDWLNEPGISGPANYEPGADAEVLGAP